MRGLTLVLFLSGCTSVIHGDADRAASAIRAWELQSDPAPLPQITLQQIGNDSDLMAAICDHLKEWSGFFGVYHFSGNRVDWQASVEHEPAEQSIHSLRVLRLTGFSNPILEVTGITHMGNGNLYLYELQGKLLILRLEAHAVDFTPDPIQFRNGALDPEYRDLNGDGFADMTITGVLEEWDEKGDVLVDSRPYLRVFLWNRDHSKFVEDTSRRVGLESSD